MKDRSGSLVVITQAVSSGTRAGPYRIDVFEGHKKRLPKTSPYKANAVLGSPARFRLAAGKYTVRARNSKEGEFIEQTSVRANDETMLPILVGKVYAQDYNDLLVQMAPVQKRFESFMLDLGQDADLQSRFLADPDNILKARKLLPVGGGLSRKNRLFIALLANKDLRKLIREGERQVKVPSEFRRRQATRVRQVLKEHVLGGRRPNPELVDVTIRRRYFFQAVLTSILTEPVLRKLYRQTLSRKEIDLLFAATYEFADRVDPKSAALSTIASAGPGIAAVITFALLNINAGVGVNNSAAIFVNAGIFTKSTVFTESRIFTSTRIVCSLSPIIVRELGISDGYELFEDHTVEPKLSKAFQLDDIQVNEISNYATIADAIIEGLNVMDFDKALAYAREQLNAAR